MAKRQCTAFYTYDTPAASAACRFPYPGPDALIPPAAWDFFCRYGYVVITGCVPREVVEAVDTQLLQEIKARLLDPAVAASIASYSDLREEHLPGNGSRNIRRSEGFPHLPALHVLRRRPEPLHVAQQLHAACGGVPVTRRGVQPGTGSEEVKEEGAPAATAAPPGPETQPLLPSIDALFLGVRANRTSTQRLDGSIPKPHGGDYSGACTLHSDQAPTWSSAHGATSTMKVAGTISLTDTLAASPEEGLLPGAGATIVVPGSHLHTEEYALELLLYTIQRAACSAAQAVEHVQQRDLDLARRLCKARGWVKQEQQLTEWEVLLRSKGRLVETDVPRGTAAGRKTGEVVTAFHSHFVDYSRCPPLARRLAKQAVAIGLRKGDYLLWNNRLAHSGMPGLRRALCLTYAPCAWAAPGLLSWRAAAFLCGCSMINHPDVKRAFLWREFHFARRPPAAHALRRTTPLQDVLAKALDKERQQAFRRLVDKYRTVPAMAAAIDAGVVDPAAWLLPWQLAYCEGRAGGYVQKSSSDACLYRRDAITAQETP